MVSHKIIIMKKVLTLLITIILCFLSFGLTACGGTEEGNSKYDTQEVQPYIIASLYPVEGRNTVTGIYRQVGCIGNKPLIRVETPELEGWYVTYASDNERMCTVDENGRCEVFRAGTVYITVTYTNGVDKVTDILSMYNTHWNRDIDVFFRGEGLDPAGDFMSKEWTMSLGSPVTLTPLLVFSSGMFDDCEIMSINIADKGVLTYENGVLTPVSAGSTKIVIDCTWRGFTSTSFAGDSTYGGTGSADLKREITVTVS